MAEKLGHIAADPRARMGLIITEADVVRREPYSLRDLRRIFATSTYVAPIDIPIAGGGGAGHWLPLPALFTGARLKELGQRLVGDFRQIDGLWCIHITDLPDEHDEEDRKAGWGEDDFQGLEDGRRTAVCPGARRIGAMRLSEFLGPAQEGWLPAAVPRAEGVSRPDNERMARVLGAAHG